MVSVHADDIITFLQLVGQQDEVGENKYEVSLMAATGGTSSQREQEKTTQLSKVSPQTKPNPGSVLRPNQIQGQSSDRTKSRVCPQTEPNPGSVLRPNQIQGLSSDRTKSRVSPQTEPNPGSVFRPNQIQGQSSDRTKSRVSLQTRPV